MAFGMNAPTPGDFADIVKYDAKAGRLLRPDYDPNTRVKTVVDITSPPPRFAFDFGSLEVGYVHFAPTGPDFRMVPEGQPLPQQPSDKDAEGRLQFKPAFRAKVYGKILLGLREFASSANVVVESVEDLYRKFQSAAEAQEGKVPVVELTRTIPIQMGKGIRQAIAYAPCWQITGWTGRLDEWGARSVPPPLGGPRTSAPPAAAVREFEPEGITSTKPLATPKGGTIEDDLIPF